MLFRSLSSGDAVKAVPLFTQSIESRELGPEALANVLLNRAMAYQQLAENNKAIDDYTAALSLDAMTSDLRARVLYNRGLAQQKADHAALAIEDFTSALQLIRHSLRLIWRARMPCARMASICFRFPTMNVRLNIIIRKWRGFITARLWHMNP